MADSIVLSDVGGFDTSEDKVIVVRIEVRDGEGVKLAKDLIEEDIFVGETSVGTTIEVEVEEEALFGSELALGLALTTTYFGPVVDVQVGVCELRIVLSTVCVGPGMLVEPAPSLSK